MVYQALPNITSTIPTHESQNLNSINSSKLRYYVSWLLSTSLFGVVLLFVYKYAQSRSAEVCGLSAQEALSLGCRFDVMSFAWLPKQCYDQELTDQFLHLRDWQWYLDADGQHPVDLTTITTGAYDKLYVTQEYHMYHCTYMWRKMHRAIQEDRPIDGYIGQFGHTIHCEGMLLSQRSAMNETNTSIFIKYVECPLVREDRRAARWYRIVDGNRLFNTFD